MSLLRSSLRYPLIISRALRASSIRPYSASTSTHAPLPPLPLPHTRTRTRRYLTRTAVLSLALGGGYLADREFNASSITRSLRTIYICALITADYKLNFTPEKSDLIPELHSRVAERIHHLLTSNGGLYIKIGQAIGANAALLPPPIRAKFASLFDDAPQIPYSVVRKVLESELGVPPDGPGGAFEYFDPVAVASASIAQVHRAKLWPREGDKEGEERWVAVKVQKPAVAKQMEWDLAAYAGVMYAFEHWAFDLPVTFVVDFVSEHLRQELDFLREANNAQRTAEFVENDNRLRGRVHVPKVYPELTTKRVMTAEWIDGIRMSDSQALKASGHAPEIMKTMIELFSAQMFDWGWVHCDPHPGNVLVRPRPDDPKRRTQLVLLDHGLYVGVEEEMRREWGMLWRAMLVGDYRGVEEVARGWGFGVPELVASFTLMRPTVLNKNKPPKKSSSSSSPSPSSNSTSPSPTDSTSPTQPPQPPRPPTQYELSVRMKAQLQAFLADTDRTPKVLIFLTRNMRMVQGNNQALGAPVNRVKIMGVWASGAVARLEASSSNGTGERNTGLFAQFTPRAIGKRVRAWTDHLRFVTALFVLDVLFYRARVEQIWTEVVARVWGRGKREGVDFEAQLAKNVRGMARERFGVEVGEEVFEG